MVLLTEYVQWALVGLHGQTGHLGRDRTLELVRARFYWPKMADEVDQWIRQCERCTRRKVSPLAHQVAPLVTIETSYPMELVCLDFLTLEESKGGYANILVITDHSTRFSQAIATHDQTAKTAHVLYDNFLVHYEFPTCLHSDQGRDFETNIRKQLCRVTGIEKSRTTPYHPMGNGMVERFNQTLLNMLGTLQENQKSNWKEYLPSLVYSYNTTNNDSTGYSPYFLMFGRHPRLPVDIYLGLEPENQKAGNHSKYAKDLREGISYTFDLVSQESKNQADSYKTRYDLRAR